MAIPRGIAFVLLLALTALGITACGGDQGSTSGDQSGGHGREVGVASMPPSHVKPTSGPGHGASGQRESSTSSSSAPESRNAPEPRDDSGGGSAQFRGRGDNSVQESGSEADEPEFEQAAAALHGYLEAQAAGRWQAACSYMESGFRDSVEQLALSGGEQGGPGEGPDASCAAALAALSGGLSPAAAQEAAVADAGALRIDGDQGYLLFHGAHHSDFFMPMAREAGRWKIAALAASELP